MRKKTHNKRHNKRHSKKKRTTRGGGCGCGGKPNSENSVFKMKGGGDGYTNPASIVYHGSGQNYYPHNTQVGGDPNDPSNMIGSRGLPNMGMRIGGGSKKKTKRRKHTKKGRRIMKGGYAVPQGTLENPMFPSWINRGGSAFSFLGPPVGPPSALASPQVNEI